MLLGFLVAGFLTLLAALAACLWYIIRTVRERSPSPSELVARMTELEGEFMAMSDGNARFLKRIGKRERDEQKRIQDGPAETTFTNRERVLAKLRASRGAS